MTKNEELDRLFKEWEKAVPDYKGKFVSDGIISEALYDTASKKILFIAKEPNDPKPIETWDFRILWRDQFKYPFTYRIAEWAYGLLNDFPAYDELWIDRSKLIQALHSIAFMNVKRIGGGAKSKEKEIYTHTQMNKSFLLREIEIIQPEIIILCLSWWQETIDLLFDKVSWEESCKIPVGKTNNAKIVSFYHPSQYTYEADYLYSLLKQIS